MFDFKKGDPDNLEGRVIIYLTADRDNAFHAFRAEIKFEKSDDPQVFTPVILTGNSIIEPTMYNLAVHLSNYQMLTENQPLEENCDVVCLGNVHAENFQSIIKALHSGIDMYSCFYADQQLFKQSIKDKDQFELAYDDNIPDYRSQTPGEINSFLYSQLGLLKDAITGGNEPKETAISKCLTDYLKDSSCTQDIAEVIRLAHLSDNSSLRLIELHVEKIVQVLQDKRECYVKAAEINDQIRQILDSQASNQKP